MRIKIIIAVLTAALIAYFVLLIERAVDLLQSGTAVGIGLGAAVIVMPFIGAVLVAYEIRFGVQTGRLAGQLTDADPLPAQEDLPKRASGRVQRDAADAYFHTVSARVETDPGRWQGWYLLGNAYDIAGDRKRARSAMRRAIALAGPAVIRRSAAKSAGLSPGRER